MSIRTGMSRRELIPAGGQRMERTAEQIAAAAPGLDYPATKVGAIGNVTVSYDSALGSQGLALAQRLLNSVATPYDDMQVYFGIKGGNVQVIVAPLSGKNDGSGGAYHHGCDFSSGGTLYLDATFASTAINPLDLEVALYVAELSECFMGAQGKGWGCGYSNGEGLSRFCAEIETPLGTLNGFLTAPAWAKAGFPDWATKTEQTDGDDISTGCAIVYIYWMLSLGFSITQIVEAGGSTLSVNYQKLTGKKTAYQDLLAAVKGLSITTDNPFVNGELLSYGDSGTVGNVSNPVTVGSGGWLGFKFLSAGRNALGENRIYAVNQSGQLLSYGDSGTPGNVSAPVTVGFGGWLPFQFLFCGRNAAGQDRIYAVNQAGQLLSYGDSGTPGNVSNPVEVGFGGWSEFKFLFGGRNAAGQDRIYAVNQVGQLLSYGDSGTPGNVSNPVEVGFGGWLQFKFLAGGKNAAGQDRIYAVNQAGQLLAYGDSGAPGNVSNPVEVGFGGWLPFQFLFCGANAAGQNRMYVVAAQRSLQTLKPALAGGAS
jgi:hypothetical protein